MIYPVTSPHRVRHSAPIPVEAGAERWQVGTDSRFDDLPSFTLVLVCDILNTGVYDGTVNRLMLKTQTTQARQLIVKGSNASAPDENLFFYVQRDTTPAQAIQVDKGISGGGKYVIAVTYDESDGPRIYTMPWGASVRHLQEVSYATRTVGAGATTADAASSEWIIWNAASFDDAVPLRHAVFVGLLNARLDVHDLRHLVQNTWLWRSDPRVLFALSPSGQGAYHEGAASLVDYGPLQLQAPTVDGYGVGSLGWRRKAPWGLRLTRQTDWWLDDTVASPSGSVTRKIVAVVGAP